MTPLENRRDDKNDDATQEHSSASSAAGPPPETVSGIVRVSGLREEAAASSAPAPPPSAPDDPAAMANELADVTFPSTWRGYEPTAVDAYVRRVSHTVTALQEMRTPQDVVRRALDRVGEETAAILREAEEAAQRIVTKSRSDAAERVQKAEREAHDITQRARTRLRDLDADIDRIWIERQRLIDDIRTLTDRLSHVADQAEERYPAEDFDPSGAPPVPPGPPAEPRKPTLAPVPAPPDAPTQTIGRVDAAKGKDGAGAKKKDADPKASSDDPPKD